jgi:hypothetical protein
MICERGAYKDMRSYTVTRYNDEKTDFEVNNRTQESLVRRQLVRSLRRCGFSQREFDVLFEGESWKEQLTNHEPIQGTSSDSDPDAAAVDIQRYIREELGFETRVAMFRDDGRAVNGDRQRGMFVATRKL